MKKILFLLIIVLLSVTLVGCSNATETNIFNSELISSFEFELPEYTKVCTPQKGYSCTIDSCELVEPTHFILIDVPKNLMYTCSNTYGCSKKAAIIDGNLDENQLTTIVPDETPQNSLMTIFSDGEFKIFYMSGLSQIFFGYCK